ncbi:DUF397 domain-containing protein [Streptomyces sp. NPDC048290]|uniref:DUF397 domain-containing protein n=1 Tax=Streptomyces sp. NPDC048290 TaxID=3155811 RepID=UPI00342A56BF
MNRISSTGPLRWVRSTYSGGEGQCIEWAPEYLTAHGVVPVRDSKNTEGPSLTFSSDTWGHFIEHTKSSPTA